jgi:hypothetical protein
VEATAEAGEEIEPFSSAVRLYVNLIAESSQCRRDLSDVNFLN